MRSGLVSANRNWRFLTICVDWQSWVGIERQQFQMKTAPFVLVAVMALADAHGRPPRTLAEAENRRATHLAERLKLSAVDATLFCASHNTGAVVVNDR